MSFLTRARNAIHLVEKKSKLKMGNVFYTDITRGNLPKATEYRMPAPGSEKVFQPLSAGLPLKNEFLSKGYQFQRPGQLEKDGFLDRPVSEEYLFYEEMCSPITDFNLNNYDPIAPFIKIRAPHYRARGKWAKRMEQE